MGKETIPPAVTITDLHLAAILEELRALRKVIEDLAKRCQPTK